MAVVNSDTPAVRLVDIPPSTSPQQEESFEQPIVAPEEANVNLFEDPEQSNPFEGIEDLPTTTNERVATPVRSMVMAAAMLGEQANDITSDSQALLALRDNLETAGTLIEEGREDEARQRAAMRILVERNRSLRRMRVDPAVDPQLLIDIETTLAINQQEELDRLAQIALEREAVTQVQSLLVAGREVEARALLNRFDPAKATTLDIIEDNAIKRMILAQHLERAGIDENNEGWIPWLLSTIISIPEAILAGETFWRLGNVPEGVGGYEPTWLRFFNPGSEMARQIESVQGLTAAQLQEALPQLIEEWRNNATNWGMDDPGRFREIVRQFHESISPQEQALTNVFANIDAVTLIPFVTGGRLLRSTYNLTRLGARSTAARNVAEALETTTREGAEAAAARTGISQEEIVDNALPRAINPERTPGSPPMVGLSGQVNSELDAARAAVSELSSGVVDEFPARFFNEAEAAEAIAATVSRLQDRAGMQLVDHDVVNIALPDGTTVQRVEGTIGPFASEAEAVGYATSRGMYSDPSQIVVEGGGPIIRTGPATTPVMATRDLNLTSPRSVAQARRAAGDEIPVGTKDAEGNEFLAMNDDLSKVNNEMDELEATFHDDVRDLELTEGRALTGEEKDKLWEEIIETAKEAEQINTQTALLAAAVNPNNPQTRLGSTRANYALTSANDVDVVEDVSGQFFVRTSMDVRETGFYTSPLDPPRTGAIGRHLKNASQTMDRRLFEMAREAGDRQNKYLKIFNNNWLQAYRALHKNERLYLDEILKKADNNARWFSQEELEGLWERATGRPITERVKTAYRQYIINNDAEYILRDASMYRAKLIRGFETTRFTVQGQALDRMDALIDDTMRNVPKERVYNVSDDVHYHSQGDPLTPDKLDRLKQQGYVMFQTEQPVKLNDGTVVRRFLAKRSDVEIYPLRRQQIGYRAGGHRLYADKYFVKQARVGKQPDTGNVFALNPNVYTTAPTRKAARAWAEVMERARLAVKNENATAQVLDETIFRAQKGFPKGQEFLDEIEAGNINLDHPFEAVFDREMPSFYRKRQDLENFIDEDEVGFNGFYRTNGRMYYSPKGEHLTRYDGELAPTLDPFEAQSRALFNVSGMSSFSDFKTSAIDRWVNRYRDDLNIRDLPEDEAGSPVAIFNAATVKRDTDYITLQQIESQRQAIKRILNFETPFERSYRHWLRHTGDWVGDFSERGARTLYWMMDRNPIQFLRGFAFDLKLGMFNLGQFVIQTSTMWSAAALSPKFGIQGMASVIPIRAYLLSRGNEAVLDTLVKRGVHKLAGFEDVEEFKNYVRWARQNGFFDIGDTHAQVNAAGAKSTFSSFGGAQAIRETGRMFFYEAEVWNRLTATRIAYGEAKERFGKINFNNPTHRRFIVGRAENYSFNMSHESRSWWQTGLLSVPTQFWAYNVRMIEALIGKNFTPIQKLRLLAMQMGLAGTGGVPIIAGIMEYRNMVEGRSPDVNSFEGFLQRGMFDQMAFQLLGADVQIGAKWGTGSWSTDLVKEIFGYSQYGEKTVAQFAGGATYAILGDALRTAFDFAAIWVPHESGGEEVNMDGEQIQQFFRNIATFNNFTKARIAYQYGILESTKGRIQTTGEYPLSEAIFIGLGIQPGELADLEALSAHEEHRKAAIDDIAGEANRLLQEAVARPDILLENAQKVNLLIQLTPVDLRQDVLRRIHSSRDPSIYDRLVRRRSEREVLEQVNEMTRENNGSAN